MPLVGLWLVGCAFLVAVVAQNEVPYDELLLDPTAVGGVPWYTGLVSNLGILGWATGSVAACFGAWIARVGGRRGAATMLTTGGLLSILLMFDDLLQLHVLVKPLFGIPKSVALASYLAVAGLWVGTQLREIARTRFVLLLAAGGAFAASIGFDQFGPSLGLTDTRSLVLEDASKFLGVLAWAQYFVLTSADIVRSILAELTARTPSADRPSDGVVRGRGTDPSHPADTAAGGREPIRVRNL